MIYKEHTLIRKGEIPEKAFEELVKFASYEENYKYLDVTRGGTALRLKNYVGTIVTKDGTTIEILPKIYGTEDDVTSTKQTFLKMLFHQLQQGFMLIQKMKQQKLLMQ